MATLPKESSFTPAPSGSHSAMCRRVVDLGTQDGTYMGAPSRKHQLIITWELFCEERMQDGRRFTVSKTYTWSTGKKANLRKDLEMWRGKPFVDADFGPGGFDIKKLIGAACFVTIMHEEKNGETYGNVVAVMKLPKEMAVGKPENDPLYLWLSHDEFDQKAFDALSGKLKEKIKKSPEYKAALTGEGVETKSLDAGHDPDDEIPF